MMLKIAVLVCMVSVAVVAGEECSVVRKLKVKTQWAQAFGMTEARDDLNIMVWNDMLHKFPETIERYFTRVRGDNVYSPEFRAHMARVMSGVDMTLSMIDEDDAFNAQVAHLNKQHIDSDVDAKYFDGFVDSLMEGVHSIVGRCFDKDAWKACLGLVVGGIKH